MVKIDGFAVRFSKENGCELERYKIQWDKLGKRAGFENYIKLVVRADYGTAVKRIKKAV